VFHTDGRAMGLARNRWNSIGQSMLILFPSAPINFTDPMGVGVWCGVFVGRGGVSCRRRGRGCPFLAITIPTSSCAPFIRWRSENERRAGTGKSAFHHRFVLRLGKILCARGFWTGLV